MTVKCHLHVLYAQGALVRGKDGMRPYWALISRLLVFGLFAIKIEVVLLATSFFTSKVCCEVSGVTHLLHGKFGYTLYTKNEQQLSRGLYPTPCPLLSLLVNT